MRTKQRGRVSIQIKALDAGALESVGRIARGKPLPQDRGRRLRRGLTVLDRIVKACDAHIAETLTPEDRETALRKIAKIMRETPPVARGY